MAHDSMVDTSLNTADQTVDPFSTAAVQPEGMEQTARPPDLSPTLARLYAILVAHAGEAVPAHTLQHELWGQATPATAAYLAVYLRYLREKLAAQPSSPSLVRRRRGLSYTLTRVPICSSA
jgi:DNA-binding response OmpR family regulator